MTAIQKQKEDVRVDDERRLAAIQLLQELRDAEGEERDDQLETWEFLEKALNEYRLSNRKRI